MSTAPIVCPPTATPCPGGSWVTPTPTPDGKQCQTLCPPPPDLTALLGPPASSPSSNVPNALTTAPASSQTPTNAIAEQLLNLSMPGGQSIFQTVYPVDNTGGGVFGAAPTPSPIAFLSSFSLFGLSTSVSWLLILGTAYFLFGKGTGTGKGGGR